MCNCSLCYVNTVTQIKIPRTYYAVCQNGWMDRVRTGGNTQLLLHSVIRSTVQMPKSNGTECCTVYVTANRCHVVLALCWFLTVDWSATVFRNYLAAIFHFNILTFSIFSLSFLSPLVWKRTVGGKWFSFGPGVSQPTVSKYWTKHKALNPATLTEST